MKSTNTNYGTRCTLPLQTSITYSMIPSLYELHRTHHAGTPPTHLATFFNYMHTTSIGWAVYSSPHGKVNRSINMIDDRMIDNVLIRCCLFQYRTSVVDGDTDWPADSSSTLSWSCYRTRTYDVGVPGHQSVRENSPQNSSSLGRYLQVHIVYNRTHTQYIATVGTRTKPCHSRYLKHKPSTRRKFVILV